MGISQRVSEILAAAEKSLATLASQAAKDGDYEAASCLIELARQLNSLGNKTCQTFEDQPSSPLTQPPALDEPSKLASSGSQPRAKPKKGEYPRFLREGTNLVKIGWSPSGKAEYEQKSPRQVLDLLTAAISKVGVNGKRFAMERILPLMTSDDGTKFPDYQAYLWLAWLRTAGVVVQHGRQGYSLATKGPLDSLIASHWESLPSR